MNIFTCWRYLFIILGLSKGSFALVKLFNTEDTASTQSYDCIYYTNVTSGNNETTPYCIRTNQSISLNRSFAMRMCENAGEEWNFRNLKKMNISEDEVLTWSSSIEVADRYAAYLTTGNEHFANEKVCNCSSNTFGKFCEYELITMDTFEDAIQYQFYLKMKYRNGSQLWGNITCYTTLTNCYFGLRCLIWQNICDGKQQCMDGIDEDGCEELELNECEENEYRCEDGSCISDQYWLDGQYDCSDKSDEQKISYHSLDRFFCPLTSSQFYCDEATVHNQYSSCGDGQFVLDFMLNSIQDCYNYRFENFFCEFVSRSTIRTWTLDNGHCVRKDLIYKNLTDMDEQEKCVIYLKCTLTLNASVNCDSVMSHFRSLCHDKQVNYPAAPVLKPYLQTVYQVSKLDWYVRPKYALFNGSIRCIGYRARSGQQRNLTEWEYLPTSTPLDRFFCENAEMKDIFGPQFDRNCWSDVKHSFFCQKSQQCISKHRLRNGINDCKFQEDENETQTCFMKKQHRLICSEKPPLCILPSEIGSSRHTCYRNNHYYIAELKWSLSERICRVPNSIECNIIKIYIQSPSLLKTVRENKILLFRHYCDTIWQLRMGFDESFCAKWKCPKDEYQCLSGHCIPLTYLFSSTFTYWHCPDASDGIRLLKISQLSKHNIRLLGFSWLENRKVEIIRNNILVDSRAFISICRSFDKYGCILANVNDPLDFKTNPPCINATQIGDGIIDCYGGLDERNLLTCGNNTFQQRGFDFHCDNQQCIPYYQQCVERCSNKNDSLLCDQLKTLRRPSCTSLTRQQICPVTSKWNCGLFESAPYYCDTSKGRDSTGDYYRFQTWLKRETWTHLSENSISTDMVTYSYIQPLQNHTIKSHSNISRRQENDGEEGWICGRGVAMKSNSVNKVQCFCPPSLYGEYCQYFSDRITLIISLDNISSHLLEQQSNIIKILALFLSNDTVIDHHVFHLPLVLSNDLNKKFRFNLIHQRPRLLSNSYIVRFEAYYLTMDFSITFLAVWEYFIYLPFLPSFRLVHVLTFEKQFPLVQAAHICNTANPCFNGSTCYPLMNKINDTSAYYCHCKSHSFGKNCSHFQQLEPLSICSKYSIVRRLSSSKSICLCSSHLYGPTCHLKHTCVNKNPCSIDRGKCYINPDNITHDFICICDKKYFGHRCELDSAMVRINFTDLSFVQIPSNLILSSIVQLCDLDNETLDFIIREKRVFQGLPPSIIEIYHNDYHLPKLGIIKLYHKHDLSNDYVANLQRQDYFILYITFPNVSRMYLSSAINRTNYCPYTPIAFQKNVSDISYLSELLYSNEQNTKSQFNATTMVFEYHLLCDEPYSLMCFQDDNYFCVCDKYDHAECFRYESKLDECHGRCRAGGQCIHGDLDDRRDFVCLCPQCYYGSVCQHNTELFSFTLETLLTNDLYSPSIVIQRLFFSLLIIVPIILFLVGGVSNVCCYVTFNRRKPLLVGAGHYLRTVSIINQLTLLILMFKLIHLVLSIKGYIIHQIVNIVLCKTLSYLLSCTSRMSYWLMGMVAIERVYVTWYLKGTWLKSPRTATRIIITIILGIIVFDIHDVIYYQSIEDPKSVEMNNSRWCVTSYPSVIATYNQVNIILNYVLPFLINLLSTIILIILITRKRATATVKRVDHARSGEVRKSTFRVYTGLLVENRELILAPSLTMLPQLFSLPQFILSFSLACQEFKIGWQRYLLIASYFITYLPQVLSYTLYIATSTFYKTEFHATKLYKKINGGRKPLATKEVETTFNHTTNATLTKI